MYIEYIKLITIGGVIVNINLDNWFVRIIYNHIEHYDHKRYWEMRKEVVNPRSKVPKLLRLFYLLRIKRMDAFNKSSMGTGLGEGAHFSQPPILNHGLNGIIITYFATIGNNCKIFQQVTISEKDGKGATIGDNCTLGAGSKIIGNVKIGNNVIVGANCIVVKDIPDNSIVVSSPARILPNLHVAKQ
jgi:serine O-acetyltransferase